MNKLLVSLLVVVSLTGCLADNQMTGVYKNEDGQIDILQTSDSTFMFKILTVSPTGGHGIGDLEGKADFYNKNKISSFSDNTYGLCHITFFFDKEKLFVSQVGTCGMGNGANPTGIYSKSIIR